MSLKKNLIPISLCSLILLAGCGGVQLSRFQVVKKISLPLGKAPEMLGVDFPSSYSIRVPTDYAFYPKELLFSDGIDKSVKRFSQDGHLVTRMLPPSPFSPGRVGQNQKHEVYVQNTLESGVEGSAEFFELLKFDSKGQYVKKLGPFSGYLDKLTIAGNSDLLLVIREGDFWRVEKFIDDLKIHTLKIEEIPALSGTNTGSFISSVYPFQDGKFILVTVELPQETKKGVETLQKHLVIELLSKKTVKEIIRKTDLPSTLAAVDQKGNLYYFKYKKKSYVEVMVQNVDYDLVIRKSWHIPFKNRDGYLISSYINDLGYLYQIRANKRRLSILQYQ